MSELRLYKASEIATALGVCRETIYKRSRNGLKGNKNKPAETPWTIHSVVNCMGGKAKLYLFDDLPKDVKKAINSWEKNTVSTSTLSVLKMNV